MRDNFGNILNSGKCISEEVLLKYMDGTLSPAEQHRVEKHLLDCELCRDAFDGLSALNPEALLKDLGEINQRIDQRIAKEKRTIKPLVFYRIAAVLAVVLLLGGGIYYLSSVKKAERVFAESFEPYHDASLLISPPASPGTEKETLPEKENTSVKQKGEKLSGNKESEPVARATSPQQPVSVTGKESREADKKQAGNTRDEEHQTDVSKVPENTFSTTSNVTGTTETKAMTDEGAAISKNAQPAVADGSKEETFRLKEAFKDKQAEKKSSSVAVPSSIQNPAPVSTALMTDGIAKYDAKNYSGAIAVFKEVLRNDPSNTDALFYSGVSHLSINESDAAINQLELVLKNAPSKFSDAAKWYLSLAYLQKNKTSKAKKLLQELSAGNSEYKSSAEKALGELK